MDPNVQVAFVSFMGVVVATAGVVMAAVINNRRERGRAASAGVEAALDEKDVLERLLSLIAENDRKEGTITRLRENVLMLTEENRMLKAENAHLILELGSKGDSS
jgi:hypothetical protein